MEPIYKLAYGNHCGLFFGGGVVFAMDLVFLCIQCYNWLAKGLNPAVEYKVELEML